MALSRLQQIAILQEASEATAATYANLFVAANAKYLVIDPSLDISVNTYERNIKRGSLTRLQSLTGTKTATARFSVELAGDTTAADAPAWGLPLRACGFRQERLVRLTIGAITGDTFPHGTFITGGTSNATGMVVGSVWNGETSLYVAQENMLGHAPEATTITEFANGETITGGGASATITAAPTGSSTSLSRATPAGYGWFPWSYSLGTLTTTAAALSSQSVGTTLYCWRSSTSTNTGVIQIAGYKPSDTSVSWAGAVQGKILFRRISGWPALNNELRTAPDGGGSLVATVAADATQFQIPTLSIGMTKDGVRQAMKAARGTVSLSGRIGEPMILNFEFQGSINTNSGAPYQDAGNIAGITYTSQIPPVLLDADLNQGKTTTLTSGAEYGPCISQIDIAMANEIAFRECMADAAGIQETILASRTPTISIDPELVAEGSWDYLTQFYNNSTTRARFSIGSSLQNQFFIKMPGVSWTAETTGDRNGIATRQLQGVLHGGSQSSSSTAEDNELALIYRIL